MAIKAKGQITLSSVIDVKATYRYYLLQSSTLSKPSKPTSYPPSSSWSDTEPSYTDGSTNSLYFVDCTVFCDDTFIYSQVSLSSSYEAAKAAYNKAANAQAGVESLGTRVTKAEASIEQNEEAILLRATKEEVNNITIGGRNLLLNSSFKENLDQWETQGDIFGITKTKEDVGVVTLDDASDQYPASAWVNPNSAVADVSTVSVEVCGKNIFNYKALVDYANAVYGQAKENDTYNGEECFSFKLWRTSDDPIVPRFMKGKFKENTQYTISFTAVCTGNANPSNGVFSVYYTDSTSDVVSVNKSDALDQRIIFTTQAGKTIQYIDIVRYGGGTTVYIKKDMQIEIGAAATEYEPYVELHETSVNLLNLNREISTLSSDAVNTAARDFDFTKCYPGLSASNYYRPDNVTSIDIASDRLSFVAKSGYGVGYPIKVIPSTRYTLSYTAISGSVLLGVSYYKSDGTYISGVYSTTGLTTPDECSVVVIVFGSNSTDGTPIEIGPSQFQLGVTATEYEPYIEPVIYQADENGFIDNLPVVSPNMTVTAIPPANIELAYSPIHGFVTKNGRQCLNIKHPEGEFEVIKTVRQDVLSKIDRDSVYTVSGWFLTENLVRGMTDPFYKIYVDGYYDNNGTNAWYHLGSFDLPDTAGEWQYVTGALDGSNLPETATTCMLYVHTRDITGDVYFYDLKLEKGNKATDWTPAPEDVDQKIAEKTNNLQMEIAEVSASIETTADAVTMKALESYVKMDDFDSYKESASAELTTEAGKITARVEEVETVVENGEFTQVKVKGKNFVMDSDGFTVEDVNPESGKDIKTTVSNNGMTVYSDNNAVLTANDGGVKAKDLHATTYLIVGQNSRFEDYAGGTRTACFWIGN